MAPPKKTHCVRGHALAGTNLIVRVEHGREVRVCRACRRDASRRSKQTRDRAKRAQRVVGRMGQAPSLAISVGSRYAARLAEAKQEFAAWDQTPRTTHRLPLGKSA